jgi:internalin A
MRVSFLAAAVIALAGSAGVRAASLPDSNVADWIQAQGGDVVRDKDGRIVEVSLARTWATDNDLEHILGLKDLKRLNLALTYVSNRGIERLQKLDQLEDLNLYAAEFITDAATSYLRANKRLRRLNLRGTDVTDTSLEYLSALTGLKSLDISQTQISDVGLDHLASLAELEELNIGGIKISGVGLNVLKLLPKLKTLSFNGIQRRNAGMCWAPVVTDIELDTISLLSGLEELDLGWGVGLGNNDPAAKGRFTGESDCHVVGGIRITDLGLAKLTKLKKLQRLDVSGSEITPAGLKQLEGLTQLRSLSLWNCKALDDSAATGLAALPNLTKLDLSYTNVGDQALASLAGLPRLKELYLTDTRVTLAGFESFHKKDPKCLLSWGRRPPAYFPAVHKTGSKARDE